MDSKKELAARLIGLGATPARVARIIGCNRKTVSRWNRSADFRDLALSLRNEPEPEATITLFELLATGSERVRLDAALALRKHASAAQVPDGGSDPALGEWAAS